MSEQGQYSAYLELVELSDGDIVLRHSNGEEQPMVLIRFSEESLEWLGEARMEVARQMVQAGIQAFNRISSSGGQEEPERSAPRRRRRQSGPVKTQNVPISEDAAEQDVEEELPTVH